MPDLTVGEMAMLAPLVALVLLLGLYPKVLLDRIEPSTEAILDRIEAATDYVAPPPGRLGSLFAGGLEEGEG
jgi:NADH-quinone oxidoreductase subunit M